MDYRQAVAAALAGDGQGFAWLYEATQHDMYYIALKYMKNEDDAMDVLQDSYMKAWQSLASLKEPENFRAWFGRIVANTAKNALVKKRPTLFSQMDTENEDGDSFEFDIEDDRKEYQPERSYTEKETQLLVRELIDSLSDEQRLCIMMYHLDGQSIKDIAQAFGVSENTVKSRLLYGRKAIKAKAEEMQKKGYQLYSFAPLPLLLFLLRSERKSQAFAAMAEAVKKVQQETVLTNTGAHAQGTGNSGAQGAGNSGVQGRRNSGMQGTAYSGAAKQAAGQAAGQAAKRGFIHTVAGKVVLGVISAAVIGGASATTTYFVLEHMSNKKAQESYEAMAENKDDALSETVPEETVMETEQVVQTEAPETEPPETEPPVREVADTEYPSLLAGELTKSELNLVLSYGPTEIGEGGLSDADLFYWFPLICMGDEQEGNLISSFGMNADYTYGCSVEDANRFASVLTDTRFSENNDNDALRVSGGRINFYGVTLSYGASTQISSAKHTEDAMVIQYTHTTTYYNDSGRKETAKKEALLKPDADGKFKIVRIYNVDNRPAEAEEIFEKTAKKSEDKTSDKSSSKVAEDGDYSIYQPVLDYAAEGANGYDFPGYEDVLSGELEYTLYDMDHDGTKDLLLRDKQNIPQPILYYVYRVFEKEQTEKEIKYNFYDGIISSTDWYATEDGNGVYTCEVSRGNGDIDYYRVTAEDGKLTMADRPEISTTIGTQEAKTYADKFPKLTWYPISDRSALEK